ncbi:SDR family NAD(P)-dependent oxidoreductase [Pseudonocardia sp. NPDC049154]|uniref:SDR family NAD(P)-dependent oxidoreductase n=1 Tax=Pseudonocardia sp. NPDC049154 TaxID=3155501 RepID=UPI003403D94B
MKRPLNGTSLVGEVAVVTGASRGIGAAIARALAAEGAAVVAAARSTSERPGKLAGTLEETVSAIADVGGRAIAVPTDLTDPAAREHLVRAAEQEFGKVDILVNNAAVVHFAPGSAFPDRQAELMLAVNVHAPLHLCRMVLPGMRDRASGRICNITSDVAGHPRTPPSRFGRTGTATVYGMCKAALERMTTGLSAEVWEDGVRVTALGPAKVVPTPGTVFHGVTREGDPRSEPPTVMAEAVARLCGPEGAAIGGRVLRSQDLLDELAGAVSSDV